jgi:hypothetical protein
VDKLADAFEKQFIKGLPDFGLYSKNDQTQGEEAIKEKLAQFGIDKNPSRKNTA